MASLQLKGDSWHLQFSYGGDRRTWVLGAIKEIDARAAKGKAEYLLALVKQRLLSVPGGVDIVTFLQHDGRPPLLDLSKPRQDITLQELWQAYLGKHNTGQLEASTVEYRSGHMRRICQYFGASSSADSLGLPELQRYADHRLASVSPVTVMLEISTLRIIFRWGARFGRVHQPLPSGGVVYPKSDALPGWVTLAEFRRRSSLGTDVAALADAVYLTAQEVASFLDWVQGVRWRASWLYPACVFVAHTGARRSEMRRLRPVDIDIASRTITIHERKRARGIRTTRSVPMSDRVLSALGPLASGRDYCFGRGRRPMCVATSAGVLRRALRGSDWSDVRGWHTLRHSFISALASNGVDQRIIDSLVGHQTEEQRRRYRHLYPSTQQEAIRRVFG